MAYLEITAASDIHTPSRYAYRDYGRDDKFAYIQENFARHPRSCRPHSRRQLDDVALGEGHASFAHHDDRRFISATRIFSREVNGFTSAISRHALDTCRRRRLRSQACARLVARDISLACRLRPAKMKPIPRRLDAADATSRDARRDTRIPTRRIAYRDRADDASASPSSQERGARADLRMGTARQAFIMAIFTGDNASLSAA